MEIHDSYLLTAHLKSTMSLATKKSDFCFNRKLYKQAFTKGLPLGPTLAKDFLSYLFTVWRFHQNLSIRLHYHQGYVDDIFDLVTTIEHFTSTSFL